MLWKVIVFLTCFNQNKSDNNNDDDDDDVDDANDDVANERSNRDNEINDEPICHNEYGGSI